MPPDTPPSILGDHHSNGDAPLPLGPRHKLIRNIFGLLIPGLLFVILLAGAIWLSHFSSRAVAADALRHMFNHPNTQFEGTLSSKTKQRLEDPVVISFKAQKQNNLVYTDSILRLSEANQTIEVPVETISDNQQNNYIKIKDQAFFESLVKSVNPQASLELIRAEAVFSSVLKKQWLKVTPQEMRAIYQEPALQQTIQPLASQPCFAILLSGNPESNVQLAESLTSILTDPSVSVLGEKTIHNIPHRQYRVELATKDLKDSWSNLLASSELKEFNECVGEQPGNAAPKIVADMWINEDTRVLGRLQFALVMPEKTSTLTMDVAFSDTNLKAIPSGAVTVGSLSELVSARQAEVDTFFESRLKSFPELNRLVEKLRETEEESRRLGL